NSGNSFALRLFLGHKAFSQVSGNQSLLKAEVGGRILKATKDSFGLCALGAGEYQNDIFLIFRGTTTANNKADYLSDARIGITMSKTCLPVHIGFNHAFESMLPEIRQFIIESNVMGYVHCIGHSLGGAVASLTADWVSKNRGNTVKLYSFGAPRVGTEMFVKDTTRRVRECNMHRVYHRTDPVPMVALYPFMQAPYSSAGHYICSAEPLTSGAAHSMKKYLHSVSNQSWKKLSASPEQPYTIESAIENWLKSKSPVDSSSPTFWRWVDSALIYVLKKVAMQTVLNLQMSFMGFFTLADKIAYLLAKGIELADNISQWVELLMRKLMQALHMRVAKTKKELTRSLIHYVLTRITENANRNARNALRGL
ncbi:MAG: lipase family protein, partial [Gammaproteobacteria bacterium]|nr:lipase family protein [Gammaproteobacteria bacterium]